MHPAQLLLLCFRVHMTCVLVCRPSQHFAAAAGSWKPPSFVAVAYVCGFCSVGSPRPSSSLAFTLKMPLRS